jgi:hypothetical protein
MAAERYAGQHFTKEGFAERFERTLVSVASTDPRVALAASGIDTP